MSPETPPSGGGGDLDRNALNERHAPQHVDVPKKIHVTVEHATIMVLGSGQGQYEASARMLVLVRVDLAVETENC